nr:2-ketogluconate 6-phosphate reductase [Raoultella sp. NCTC 9187]
MKPSVILYKTLPDDLQQRLEKHFAVTRVKNLSAETIAQHAEAFAQAEGLLGSSEKVDTALLEKMPNLRAASTVSVGYDNFDVAALNARRVLLMHTPTVLTETVADTVMALVLSTSRRVVEVANRVKAGEWTKSIGPDWFGSDVHHKTLGIVGMGRIGMALAQRAHAGFGMPILYNARSQHPQAEERFNARYCDLDTLLEEADFVCLILPLTAETHHLFNAEKFAKMKPSAIFINAGRGPVVDEKRWLPRCRMAKSMPPVSTCLNRSRWRRTPRCSACLTSSRWPHIGSATHETRYNMAACAVDNLIDALQGNVDKNCVNPQVK